MAKLTLRVNGGARDAELDDPDTPTLSRALHEEIVWDRQRTTSVRVRLRTVPSPPERVEAALEGRSA
jgi:hypothetical protein